MTDVEAVPQVDLQRYSGLWYELGRLPLKYEDDAATDVTATYTLEDGGVRVDNRCIDEDGKPTQTIGRAEAVDESNAKLTVTFLPEFLRWIPFTRGDYWVLRLADDYSVALVGTPDRKFLWLLSRTPEIGDALTEEYLSTARGMGFDLADWITTPHTGRPVSDADLAA